MEVQEFEDRRFVIFSVSELNQIDFNEVLETSSDTVRKSVDQKKTFVKWEGEMPECIVNLITKEGPYTYDEIMTILQTSSWKDPELF